MTTPTLAQIAADTSGTILAALARLARSLSGAMRYALDGLAASGLDSSMSSRTVSALQARGLVDEDHGPTVQGLAVLVLVGLDEARQVLADPVDGDTVQAWTVATSEADTAQARACALAALLANHAPADTAPAVVLGAALDVPARRGFSPARLARLAAEAEARAADGPPPPATGSLAALGAEAAAAIAEAARNGGPVFAHLPAAATPERFGRSVDCGRAPADAWPNGPGDVCHANDLRQELAQDVQELAQDVQELAQELAQDVDGWEDEAAALDAQAAAFEAEDRAAQDARAAALEVADPAAAEVLQDAAEAGRQAARGRYADQLRRCLALAQSHALDGAASLASLVGAVAALDTAGAALPSGLDADDHAALAVLAGANRPGGPGRFLLRPATPGDWKAGPWQALDVLSGEAVTLPDAGEAYRTLQAAQAATLAREAVQARAPALRRHRAAVDALAALEGLPGAYGADIVAARAALQAAASAAQKPLDDLMSAMGRMAFPLDKSTELLGEVMARAAAEAYPKGGRYHVAANGTPWTRLHGKVQTWSGSLFGWAVVSSGHAAVTNHQAAIVRAYAASQGVTPAELTGEQARAAVVSSAQEGGGRCGELPTFETTPDPTTPEAAPVAPNDKEDETMTTPETTPERPSLLDRARELQDEAEELRGRPVAGHKRRARLDAQADALDAQAAALRLQAAALGELDPSCLFLAKRDGRVEDRTTGRLMGYARKRSAGWQAGRPFDGRPASDQFHARRADALQELAALAVSEAEAATPERPQDGAELVQAAQEDTQAARAATSAAARLSRGELTTPEAAPVSSETTPEAALTARVQELAQAQADGASLAELEDHAEEVQAAATEAGAGLVEVTAQARALVSDSDDPEYTEADELGEVLATAWRRNDPGTLEGAARLANAQGQEDQAEAEARAARSREDRGGPRAEEKYQGHANQATWAASNAIRQDADRVAELRELTEAQGGDVRAALVEMLRRHPRLVEDFAPWAEGTVDLECLAEGLADYVPAPQAAPERPRKPGQGGRRARLEARAERREGWAQGRSSKAEAARQGARELADRIPLGQPILRGHHSEGRARRDQDRIHNGMRKGHEHATMAAHHAGKADGIRRQLASSIYSDDPDAVEALQAKLAELEAKRDRIKATNTAHKKHVRAALKAGAEAGSAAFLQGLQAALAAGDVPEDHAQELARLAELTPWHCAKGGFPSYTLSNLSGNVKRTRDRLAKVTERQERAAEAEAAPGGVLVERSELTGGRTWYRVTFDEKPEREVRAALKAAGFRWRGGSWQGTGPLPEEVAELVREDATPSGCARCQAERFPRAALDEDGGAALTADHSGGPDCDPVPCEGCGEALHVSEFNAGRCGSCGPDGDDTPSGPDGDDTPSGPDGDDTPSGPTWGGESMTAAELETAAELVRTCPATFQAVGAYLDDGATFEETRAALGVSCSEARQVLAGAEAPEPEYHGAAPVALGPKAAPELPELVAGSWIADEAEGERLGPVAEAAGVTVKRGPLGSGRDKLQGPAAGLLKFAEALVEEWSGTDEEGAARRLRSARRFLERAQRETLPERLQELADGALARAEALARRRTDDPERLQALAEARRTQAEADRRGKGGPDTVRIDGAGTERPTYYRGPRCVGEVWAANGRWIGASVYEVECFTHEDRGEVSRWVVARSTWGRGDPQAAPSPMALEAVTQDECSPGNPCTPTPGGPERCPWCWRGFPVTEDTPEDTPQATPEPKWTGEPGNVPAVGSKVRMVNSLDGALRGELAEVLGHEVHGGYLMVRVKVTGSGKAPLAAGFDVTTYTERTAPGVYLDHEGVPCHQAAPERPLDDVARELDSKAAQELVTMADDMPALSTGSDWDSILADARHLRQYGALRRGRYGVKREGRASLGWYVGEDNQSGPNDAVQFAATARRVASSSALVTNGGDPAPCFVRAAIVFWGAWFADAGEFRALRELDPVEALLGTSKPTPLAHVAVPSQDQAALDEGRPVLQAAPRLESVEAVLAQSAEAYVTLRGLKVRRGDVLAQLDRCDELGKAAFLAENGYGDSTRYHLRYNGRSYPSKAILGAAAGLQAADFFGGAAETVRLLNRLGFYVRHSETGERVTEAGLEALRKLAVAQGFDDPAPAWPELPVVPSAYFASGSNRPAEIRGLSKIGADVGVAAPELTQAALAELLELKGTDVQVFVDSGAFSEVDMTPSGPVVARPISHEAWLGILDKYLVLGEKLGRQLWVVAPDQVGDQDATLRRLLTYRPQLARIGATGARILVPLQRGARSLAKFARSVDKVLRGVLDIRIPWLPALPCKKAATSPEEVREFLSKTIDEFPHVHLLGLGVRNRKLPQYLAPFAELAPATSVSLDSCWIRANVGKGRRFTEARKKVDEALVVSGLPLADLRVEAALMLCLGAPLPSGPTCYDTDTTTLTEEDPAMATPTPSDELLHHRALTAARSLGLQATRSAEGFTWALDGTRVELTWRAHAGWAFRDGLGAQSEFPTARAALRAAFPEAAPVASQVELAEAAEYAQAVTDKGHLVRMTSSGPLIWWEGAWVAPTETGGFVSETYTLAALPEVTASGEGSEADADGVAPVPLAELSDLVQVELSERAADLLPTDLTHGYVRHKRGRGYRWSFSAPRAALLAALDELGAGARSGTDRRARSDARALAVSLRAEATAPAQELSVTERPVSLSDVSRFKVGQLVEVHAMGHWYLGVTTKVGRKRVTVRYRSGAGVEREKAVGADKVRWAYPSAAPAYPWPELNELATGPAPDPQAALAEVQAALAELEASEPQARSANYYDQRAHAKAHGKWSRELTAARQAALTLAGEGAVPAPERTPEAEAVQVFKACLKARAEYGRISYEHSDLKRGTKADVAAALKAKQDTQAAVAALVGWTYDQLKEAERRADEAEVDLSWLEDEEDEGPGPDAHVVTQGELAPTLESVTESADLDEAAGLDDLFGEDEGPASEALEQAAQAWRQARRAKGTPDYPRAVQELQRTLNDLGVTIEQAQAAAEAPQDDANLCDLCGEEPYELGGDCDHTPEERVSLRQGTPAEPEQVMETVQADPDVCATCGKLPYELGGSCTGEHEGNGAGDVLRDLGVMPEVEAGAGEGEMQPCPRRQEHEVGYEELDTSNPAASGVDYPALLERARRQAADARRIAELSEEVAQLRAELQGARVKSSGDPVNTLIMFATELASDDQERTRLLLWALRAVDEKTSLFLEQWGDEDNELRGYLRELLGAAPEPRNPPPPALPLRTAPAVPLDADRFPTGTAGRGPAMLLDGNGFSLGHDGTSAPRVTHRVRVALDYLEAREVERKARARNKAARTRLLDKLHRDEVLILPDGRQVSKTLVERDSYWVSGSSFWQVSVKEPSDGDEG
jgi:hypothetical protein